MKFGLKYELFVMDDDGNVVADAAANLNVSNLDQLVKTVLGAAATIESVIEKAAKMDASTAANAEAGAIFEILTGRNVKQ